MKKEWIFRIILLVGSILLTLFVVNLVIGKTDSSPASVSEISFNDSINLANQAFADKNPYGFTDRPRTKQKAPGIYRIAVLGDSFIWSDGMHYELAWSHKLEQKLLAYCDSIEVMHWGMNGWQTHDEFQFYLDEGASYKPDLLIIGYVDNDPDMGLFNHMDPSFRTKYKWLYRIAPDLTSSILERLYANSYQNWVDKIHSLENLTIYGALLDSFNNRLTADSLDHFIVQTPSCIVDGCNEFYDRVKPFIEHAGFEYIDVFKPVNEQLAEMPFDSLKANPVNFHPGFRVTEVFADEVMQYLIDTKRLPCQSTVTEP